MRVLLLGLVAALQVLNVGCATSAKYAKAKQTWVGRSADELVARMGIPTKTLDMPSGKGKIYQYDWNGGTRTFTNYNQYAPENAQVTSTNVTYWCNDRYIVNEMGFITQVTWEGNACKAN